MPLYGHSGHYAMPHFLLTSLYEYRNLLNRTGYAATQTISFSSILKLKARNVYHGCYVEKSRIAFEICLAPFKMNGKHCVACIASL